MKAIARTLAVGLVLYGCAAIYDATRPVEHLNISVVVQRGDTLQDIICDLQEKYGDRRDWREICYEVRKAHGFTKWIYPGQELVIPLQIKK
jgi:nucleoid-associated protein YgaU